MLTEDYPSVEALRKAIPGLILARNLHGVDIDPRCAQIAQFALWMRAQRAFGEFKIARGDRPIIRRANIVIAEPMPGEKDLLQDFLAELKEERLEDLIRRALQIPANSKVRVTKAMADSLAELVNTVWDGMKLAGEMGTLLKIERDIARASRRPAPNGTTACRCFASRIMALAVRQVKRWSGWFREKAKTSGRRPKNSSSKPWQTTWRPRALPAMRADGCLPRTQYKDLL